MGRPVVLLPSPLLPAEAYEDLAAALTTRDSPCIVADASGAVSGPQLALTDGLLS